MLGWRFDEVSAPYFCKTAAVQNSDLRKLHRTGSGGGPRNSEGVVPGCRRPTIREARVLLNFQLDGRSARYVYYNAAENAFPLIDDSGMKSNKAGAGATVIENSQCALDV
jgi:hypothetical protein